MNKVASEEKLEFAGRLIQALRAAGLSLRPSNFSREFNSRSEGNSITVFAARKWLLGESIPTQDRLRILSTWLNVPAQWLRYGEGSSPALPDDSKIVLLDAQLIARDLQRLRPQSRRIVQGLVTLLLKTEQHK
jgi:transcriptional regulator with XRE-family HTH domain